MFARVRAPLAFALLVVASACGSDASVAPASQPADLSQVFSELSLSSVQAATSWTRAATPGPTVPIVVPSACTYSPSAQSFACPPVTVSGVTITQSYTLLSEAGTPQSAFDASKTAAVRMNTTMAGTSYTSAETVVTIDGQQSLTLSGLLTGKHTIDGTSTTHLVGTVGTGGASVLVNNTIKTTITGLMLPPSAGSVGKSAYPTAGTLVVETNSVVPGVPAQLVSAQLTFNGTSKVAVVISFGGVTEHCTFDLAASTPSCV